VKEHKTIVLLALEEIDWIEAAGDYVCVHTGGRKHLLREKISQITLQVPAAHFARIHRSAVVNLDRVVRVVSCGSGETLVHLSSGDILHVSRTFKQSLLRKFKPGSVENQTVPP
jgi:two-component system LytT family response regulator